MTIWLPTMLMACGLAFTGMCLGNGARRGTCRVFVSGGCIAALLTYLLWRLDSIAAPDGEITTAALIFSVVLVSLETINCLDHCVYLLIKSRKANRSSEADRFERELRTRDPADLPSVDIMITTYSEEWAILEKTIEGAKNIDYPNKKIWILDDTRRQWLKQRCLAECIGYITRLDNRGKKAGNQNNGLRQTEAPFILQLDADFVPMPGILIRTIGFFSDPKIAIVQTPQSFLNCEPFRWNLGLEHAMSDDAQAFYFDDQASRDAWGVSFFCGTSAVIRRTALESIGGFPEECDTEDIFTSVILLANGWRTICLPEPLSFGVAPTNLAALIKQRTRWCRGNLQMLFLKRGPLRCPGLSPFQRWAFFSPHWITGNLAQILYAIATASAWFSLSLFPPVQPLDAFFLPVVFFVTICAADWWFQRGVVLPVLKQAYNLFNAFIVLPTALATLVTPRRDVGWKITSSVTNLEKPVCWRLFVPAAALIAAILIGFLVTMTNGFYPDRAPFFALALWCWTTWQLLMLALVARASIERPRHLEEDAIAVDWPAIVHANARTWEASVNMASLSLLSLIIGNDERKELEGQTGLVEIAGIGQFAAEFSTQGLSSSDWARVEFPDTSNRKSLMRAMYRSADHFVADREPLSAILRRLVAPTSTLGSGTRA
ncbi:MAG TPA: glycosyltransferase [Terrimicrobiaceae bacterium]